MTSTGCRLECKEYGLSLTIPEGAVAKSQKEPVLFALLQDEYKPILSGKHAQLYYIDYVFNRGYILYSILYIYYSINIYIGFVLYCVFFFYIGFNLFFFLNKFIF